MMDSSLHLNRRLPFSFFTEEVENLFEVSAGMCFCTGMFLQEIKPAVRFQWWALNPWIENWRKQEHWQVQFVTVWIYSCYNTAWADDMIRSRKRSIQYWVKRERYFFLTSLTLSPFTDPFDIKQSLLCWALLFTWTFLCYKVLHN